MPDWNAIINQALRELKADVTFTRGAVLRNKIEEICKESEDDFDAYLKGSNQRFVQVIQQVSGVAIRRLPDTDMFVGLEGADWPEFRVGESEGSGQPKSRRFRSDVYDAFTKISDRGFWYFSDFDEFTQEIPASDSRIKISLPAVTLDQLREQRRSFAALQSDDLNEELIRATDRSANPLAQFQAMISRHKLGQKWHKFKADTLMEQIQNWAKENSIEFRPSWVESDQAQESRKSPQRLMADFAFLMTDDEIRSISVPFRAVEALYRKYVT